jgi:hypothetical protein
MTTPQFPDKTGRPLKEGDFIIYGHALGRCAGLQYAKVLAITIGKRGYLEEPVIKLRVQGVDLDDNFDFEDKEWTRERKKSPGYERVHLLKPSTLAFPSRVLRVTKDQIPVDVFKLLNARTKE